MKKKKDSRLSRREARIAPKTASNWQQLESRNIRWQRSNIPSNKPHE